MLTTLEHLEHHIKHRKQRSLFKGFFKEARIFLIFFLVVFIINSIVVNAQLYQNAFLDMVNQLSGSINISPVSNETNGQQGADQERILKMQQNQQAFLKKQQELRNITQSVEAMVQSTHEDFIGEDSTIAGLKRNIGNYQLNFNTLPPSDRIIIPKIDVNAPLLQSSFNKNISDITKEDFDKDLYHGVVQYPTTPYPGKGGNTLIFGHTSYEYRKHNPYATIFSKITKLNNGDNVQVIYQGKLYEYEIISKVIINPDQVNEEYLKYQDGNFISLLGCYPIGSDRQRILVVGKLKAT